MKSRKLLGYHPIPRDDQDDPELFGSLYWSRNLRNHHQGLLDAQMARMYRNFVHQFEEAHLQTEKEKTR